ncbi:MAG TPA: cupin domain-containing protein [Candidatus Dormibacteraeota bacterium]|nr:cupin domain-containing protein [Candidatus Dormibacteraeota bacterium]
MEARETVVLPSGQGRMGWLGGLGVRFMIPGAATGEGFALVEHPLKPRALAAPLHRHSREDEYSFVLRGRVGAQLGEKVLYGGPGDLIFKPRDQWHTFWNAGDTEASLLEMIAPAGFERFFEKLLEVFGGGPPEPEAIAGVAVDYGLELDFASLPRLVTEHGVRFG